MYSLSKTHNPYEKGSNILIFAKRLPLIFFLLLVVASLTNHAQAEDKPMADKPLGKGTLDYLQPNGVGSSYTLIEDENATNKYDPQKDNVPDGVLLRYDVQSSEEYYDKLTGQKAEGVPDNPDNYYKVTRKELKPVLYDFTFVESVTNPSYNGASADNGGTEYSLKIPIKALLGEGEDKVQTFTYYYFASDLKTQVSNPGNEITGVFMDQIRRGNNHRTASGGALVIDSGTGIHIKADFLNNQATRSGGAIGIYNKNTSVDEITGNFLNNASIQTPGYDDGFHQGGAIWNYQGSIGTINGYFIGNSVQSPNTGAPAQGGAVFNEEGSITTITGAFIGNYVSSGNDGNGNTTSAGGAIYNVLGGTIDAIYADFIGNHSLGKGHGGAIFNGGGGIVGNTQPSSVIKLIIGDFIGNYIEGGSKADAAGGAICNMAYGANDSCQGGAVIETIKGDFIRNYTLQENHNSNGGARGGAIYNNRQGLIKTIEGNFIRNHATTLNAGSKEAMASGGAIVNFFALNNSDVTGRKWVTNPNLCSTIETIISNFYHNYAEATGLAFAQGGAISNHSGGSVIGDIIGDFIGNYASAADNFARGGAIFTDEDSVIDSISGNFYNNHAYSENERANGGAIRNGGAMHEIRNAVFEGNYAESGFVTTSDKFLDRFVETDFVIERNEDGSPKTTVKVWRPIGAYGGAIFNESTLTITADTSDDGTGIVFFNGNYIKQGDGTTDAEAIYGRDGSEITLNAVNNSAIIFNDKIRGEQLYAIMKDGNILARFSNVTANELELKKDELKDRFKSDYNQIEQIGDGFKLLLTGDNTNSSVVFANSVSYVDVRLENITLVLHTDDDSDVAGMANSYLSDKLKAQYGDDYRVSYILRASSLDAQSGKVALQDGLTTEYFIGTLNANGYRHKPLNEIGENPASDYAIFTIDVNLNKGVSDILTVFGVKNAPEDLGWKSVSWGSDRKSVSTGYVTISPSFMLEGNSYAYEQLELKEKAFTIQVINFVVMVGQQGMPIIDDQYYKKRWGEANADIIQLTDMLGVIQWEKSHMSSSETLAQGIELTTTKTYHDSFTIVGWRDALAAWAELRADDNSHDGWVESDHGEKVFVIEANDSVDLTRDTVDTSSIIGDDPTTAKECAEIQGTKEWSIVGRSEGSELRLNEKNLLTIITDEQTARLENFTLHGVKNNEMKNDGKLTLDTMRLDDTLTIKNAVAGSNKTEDNSLTLTGNMIFKSKITTDGGQGQLFINDSSNAREKTNITIEGTVDHQHIIHSAKISNWDAAAPENSEFSTVTTLQTTRDDGETATNAFKTFQGNSLTMESGKFNLGTMHTHRLELKELALNGGVISIDSATIDLSQRDGNWATMGGIDANQVSYGDGIAPADADTNITANGGIIWLGDIKLTNDTGAWITHARFVPEELSDAVRDGLHIANEDGVKHDVEGASTKYTYSIYYGGAAIPFGGEPGAYTLVRTGWSPGMLTGSIAQQSALSQMMLIYDYSFMHADLYADSVYRARQARLYESSYAVVSPVKGAKEYAAPGAAAASAAPAQNYMPIKGGMWLRPYTSFEKIPLHNGPKVDATFYGALVGYDTDLTEHKNGWASVFTGYLGYNGSQQKWEKGNRTRTNGAVIGLTETLYKNNFYTAITLSAGASRSEAHTKFGKEDFDMQMAGIASRSGYSIDIADGKYVIQPSLLLSYTYFHVNAYDNPAGYHINADPMHAIQIHPFVKFIKHTETEWKPYLTGGFVWNLMNKTRFKVDGEKLPELSIRPYAEYSLGIQKTWKDRYTFYGQATGRSGGRNGVELSAGVRWAW